jgi:hypothetical protein
MLTDKKLITLLLMVFFSTSNAYAAGSTVKEDFSLVKSLCEDMIEVARNKDQSRFLELIDAALKLSEAQRRDSSLAIDRFRPKLRLAKKAAKQGNFDTAIGYVEEAIPLMKAATASWDGGN